MKSTKSVVIAFVLSIASFALFAQDIILIKGKITDSATGAPIPFVNMGVAGTYIGAATNMDGFYELKIPGRLKDRNLHISAVGYGTIVEPIANLSKEESKDFQMEAKTFEIGEVEILGKSRLLYTRVKKAVKNISKNYLQTPFTYDMYYRGEVSEGDSLVRLREAAVRMYDKKGYERGDAYQVFKERGYEFLEVRKNFENETLADGSTYLDELLEMDIVRVRGNVLNENQLDDYELKLDGETEYDGDKVWIIDYVNTKPNLVATGDYYIKSYKGKLYIKQKDYAVVKNVVEATATNYASQGRSFYVEAARQKQEPQEIRYTFTTTYKYHMGYYYLSYVSYVRNDEWKNKTTGAVKKNNISSELLVTQLNTFTPAPIERRAYYENKPYNEAFWKSYNIIRDRNKK